MAFLRYQTCRVDNEMGEDFTGRLASGVGLHEDELLTKLRVRLEVEARKKGTVGMPPLRRLAITIKCWNKIWEGNTTAQILTWKPGIEPFPTIAGLDEVL